MQLSRHQVMIRIYTLCHRLCNKLYNCLCMPKFSYCMGGSRGGVLGVRTPPRQRPEVTFFLQAALRIFSVEWMIWSLQSMELTTQMPGNATSGFRILKIFSGMACDYPFFGTSGVYLRGAPSYSRRIHPYERGLLTSCFYSTNWFTFHESLQFQGRVFPIKR